MSPVIYLNDFIMKQQIRNHWVFISRNLTWLLTSESVNGNSGLVYRRELSLFLTGFKYNAFLHDWEHGLIYFSQFHGTELSTNIFQCLLSGRSHYMLSLCAFSAMLCEVSSSAVFQLHFVPGLAQHTLKIWGRICKPAEKPKPHNPKLQMMFVAPNPSNPRVPHCLPAPGPTFALKLWVSDRPQRFS